MDLQEFLTGQEKVYTKFRDASKIVETEGTKPNLPQNSQGGYLIALRHPSEIAERIEAFSRRIAQTVPLMVYDAKTIHTTISDYGIKEDFAPDKETLDKLSARDFYPFRKRNPRFKNDNFLWPSISYDNWLYNQNTLLVAGRPNEDFFDMVQGVYSSGQETGIQLRMPWGAHITAGRFTEQTTPKELSDFFKLMKEAPVLGTSDPEVVDITCFDFSKGGFKLTTHGTFLHPNLLIG